MTGKPLAYLPSPTQGVWHLGPLPIHGYALCIVAGIAVALRVAANRWRTAGGRESDLWDVSGWAIVFGIIGGRVSLGSGQVFAIYVIGYTAGRGWIEALRHDHANHTLGLRLNDWTSIVVFLFGAALFIGRRQTHYSQPCIGDHSEESVDAEAS